MKRSTDRILTSHAGSLHRPDDLREAMAARRDGDPFDDKLTRRVKEAVFEVVRLPDGKILMPGVLGHCAPEFVEHPRLVAQRLIRYAKLVGRENVIGGTDRGLSRVAHPSIQWAKFRAMAEGARIASAALW